MYATQVSQNTIDTVIKELWLALNTLTQSPDYKRLTEVDKAGGIIADAITKLSDNRIN